MQIRHRVLHAWLRDVATGWGERAGRAAADTLTVLPRCRVQDLHHAGVRLAREGHSLEEVLAWFQLLARRSRRIRTLLHDGGVANLAAGWADGILATDFGVEHVAPLELLRLRLQQQVALAASRGQTPHAQLALVVVEVGGSDVPSQRALHHARSIFAAGESIAVAPNGKVLVLAPRAQDLRANTLRLTEALCRDAQLLGSTVRVWVEPLAATAEHLDSHLLGLAS